MGPTDDELKALPGYAEKILDEFKILKQYINEIQRDLHIQALSVNTKIDSFNSKLDCLLSSTKERDKELNKNIRSS
jgi:hypothetical protein